jgi:hypothetical protein
VPCPRPLSPGFSPAARASTRTKPLTWAPAAVVRSPLHPLLGSTMLRLEFVDRRYAKPVTGHQDRGSLPSTTDSPWSRNVTAGGGQATVHLRGRRRRARVPLVTDPVQALAGLLTIVRAQPGAGRWANVERAADGEPDPARPRADSTRGRVLLRLRLLDEEAR